MTAPYSDPINDAEAAAIEAATGDAIRAALRPYLDALRDISPERAHYLRSADRRGAEWVGAFYAPTRFGWPGRRWPAPLNAEIAKLVDKLYRSEEAAYFAFRTQQESP